MESYLDAYLAACLALYGLNHLVSVEVVPVLRLRRFA